MRLSLLIAAAAAAIVAGSADAVGTAAPTITIRSSTYGKILFDGKGRALYAFTRDKRGGKSTCYGACAKAWPPYVVRGRLAAGIGTKRSLLGTVKRRNGTRQVTYRGRALYYYVNDGRGEVKCQNVNEFGGLWLVVRASGKLVR
jgi:predicted lipoprotein with Yx(FWY)xxD motif